MGIQQENILFSLAWRGGEPAFRWLQGAEHRRVGGKVPSLPCAGKEGAGGHHSPWPPGATAMAKDGHCSWGEQQSTGCSQPLPEAALQQA